MESVDGAEPRVRAILDGGRRQSYRLPQGTPGYLYVKRGEAFRGLEQFVLGVVPPPGELACPGDVWDYGAELDEVDPITRYIAVKATGLRADGRFEEGLRELAASDLDLRIRLEALAGLCRLKPDEYTDEIAELAQVDSSSSREELAIAMESLFVLAELQTPEAASALAAVASEPTVASEARCAAVWGLGIAGGNAPERVLEFIADEDEDVALHALAGIGALPGHLITGLGETLRLSRTEREATSASTLLADQGHLGAKQLIGLATLADQGHLGAKQLIGLATATGRPAVWSRAALGQMPEDVVRRAADGPLPPQLEEVLAPMWAASTSWLQQQQGSTPLEFLKRQTIRHSP